MSASVRGIYLPLKRLAAVNFKRVLHRSPKKFKRTKWRRIMTQDSNAINSQRRLLWVTSNWLLCCNFLRSLDFAMTNNTNVWVKLLADVIFNKLSRDALCSNMLMSPQKIIWGTCKIYLALWICLLDCGFH